MRRGTGVHRVPRSRPGVAVSGSPSRCSARRRSTSVTWPWILPCASRLLQSTEPEPARGPTASPRSETILERLPWGFRPHRGINWKRPLPGLATEGHEPTPRLARFRPRRFSRPRRLAPLPALRVCFTPQPRPGFLFRGFPSRTAVRSRRPPLPSCRWRRLPVTGCPMTPFSSVRPSRLCSVLESVFDE
jgi:hypothetical protein